MEIWIGLFALGVFCGGVLGFGWGLAAMPFALIGVAIFEYFSSPSGFEGMVLALAYGAPFALAFGGVGLGLGALLNAVLKDKPGSGE